MERVTIEQQDALIQIAENAQVMLQFIEGLVGENDAYHVDETKSSYFPLDGKKIQSDARKVLNIVEPKSQKTSDLLIEAGL